MGSKQSKITEKSSKKSKGKDTPPPPRSNRQKRMNQEAIIDQDDRKQLQKNKTLQFIGLIRGKFKSKQQTHIGTGTVLTHDLILTVAHNVCSINTREFRKYRTHLQNAVASHLVENRSASSEETVNEFKHAEFAEWLQFYPGLNGDVCGLENIEEVIFRQNKEGNFRRVKQFKVHPSFLTEHNHQMYDICLLQLDAPVHGQKISILQNYTNITTEISVFGYPIDICFKEEGGKMTARQFGAKGRFKLDQQIGKITYRIATERGQSGSPIFINTTKGNNIEYFCIGVHSGGNPEICNVGIHLNEQKVKWLSEVEHQFTGRLTKITKLNLFPRLPENNVPAKAGKDIREKSLQDYENEIKMKEGSTSKQAIYLRREAALLSMGEEDYKRALEHYQSFVSLMQSLKEQQRNIQDQDEWQVALINLSKCHSQTGDHLKSLSLYQVAQQKCRDFHSLSAEKESVILNNQGAVMVKLQRFEQALELFKRAHKLRVNKFGEESLMTYNSLQNLASVKLKLGISVSDSIRDYEKVFKFKERKFGIGSKEAIMTKQNLSFALLQNGRYAEGIQGCHYCLQKLKSRNEHCDKFIQQFTWQMRELCRGGCNLQDLKMAYALCQQSGLTDLAQQIDNQWSKRNASQSP